MKTGLIQNNYIQLFHLIFFYKYILLQLKSSQRLKTAPLTEDGCEYPHLFTDRGFCLFGLTQKIMFKYREICHKIRNACFFP